MERFDMESHLTGRSTENPGPTSPREGKSFSTAVVLVLSAAIVAAVIYSSYNLHRFRTDMLAELARISDQVKALERRDESSESRLAEIESRISDTLKTVGATQKDLDRKARQFQTETRRAKAELQSVIASKADAEQFEALKQEAQTKIDVVSTEVGGVKSEVGTVKTDLAGTRHDLEGTQRQLMDVRDTLTAAVARNSTELAALRRKGERDYFEFSILRKNVPTKVADIQVALIKTDPKKGKFNVRIYADDSQLEKKDRTINEPVQFLVGRGQLRYELVINWIQKDRVGGYLSVPKDKTLSAERMPTGSSF